LKVLSINIFLLLLLVLFPGCQNGSEQNNTYAPKYSTQPVFKNKNLYVFGIHPLHNPSRLFQVYQPMIDYINEHLDGDELRLEASRNYAAYDKKLFSGYFDFALPNPYQTVVSTENGYRVFGKMGDDKNFRGIILLRKDSGINTVNDLKGKTVSYPAPTALAATMLPQWYLYKHGININEDTINSYVGSQESSIMNVYLGKSVAATTWPLPWHAFIKERPEVANEVFIKWETASLVNNGLVARKDIPQELVDKVGKIIFSLHTHARGKKILEAMELSKYEAADDSVYDSVRVFLQKFEDKVRPIRADNE
jgi:phosphonate transport system substrate-binding protein